MGVGVKFLLVLSLCGLMASCAKNQATSEGIASSSVPSEVQRLQERFAVEIIQDVGNEDDTGDFNGFSRNLETGRSSLCNGQDSCAGTARLGVTSSSKKSEVDVYYYNDSGTWQFTRAEKGSYQHEPVKLFKHPAYSGGYYRFYLIFNTKYGWTLQQVVTTTPSRIYHMNWNYQYN